MYIKLLHIKKAVSEYFYAYEHDKNVLAIAEDSGQPPFAFFLCDEMNYRGKILLCVAVDYDNNTNLIQLALVSGRVADVHTSEPFYTSMGDNHTYFGDDAYVYRELDSIDLASMEPESKILN